MKIKLAGSWICWLLRRHAWRRMRKAECETIPNISHIARTHRICDRCHIIRTVKPRKEKPSAPNEQKATP